MEEGGDIEAAMANEKEMEGKFVELLGKSFDHHDKSGTGDLTTEEAKAFFSNLVCESGAFMEAMFTICTKKMMDMMIKQMLEGMKSEGEEPAGENQAKMEAGMTTAMLAGVREGMKTGLEDAKTQCSKQLEDYKANKEERDAAAFEIIDVDGGGSIGKEEFIAAFTPGNKKSDRVMAALGLDMPDPDATSD